jgi:NodT family efflux transporter outer membrane factor (OMF) lipoprotein
MLKKNIVILLLFVTACHVGEETTIPPFISDEEVEEALKLSAPVNNINNTWYTLFNDKDLNTLIQFSSNNNFSIRQAMERLQQSRYSLLINAKQNYPMIDAFGEYDYSKTNANKNILLESNIFKIGLDASWELDIWGKGQYISEQYEALMKQAQFSLYNVFVSLSAEVMITYIKLKEAAEILRIMRKNLRLQEDILQTVRDKYKAGIADELALNQAKHSVSLTQSQIPSLENQLETYKNTLATLLGVLPKDIPISLDKQNNNLVAKTFKYNVSDLYKLPLNIIRTRPDVMLAEALVHQKNAAVNEAIASMYPSVSLSATFAYLSSSGRSLFQTDNQYYNYSPSLLLPIWHWEQLKNNVELQKHIKEEYLLQYNEVVLTAVMELKNAIFSLRKAYDENKLLKAAAQDMQNIMSLTYQKYQNGLVDFTDLATAEQDLLSAQRNVISSNATILLNIIAFYKATGGGYNVK